MVKRQEQNIKKFNTRMQAKLLLVFCAITILLVGLIGRLIYIMQTDGDRYAKHVLSRQSYTSAVLPYKRGDIMDRNGTVLARSEMQYRLLLDPKRLLLNEDSIPHTLDVLKTNFGIEPDTIYQVLKDRPQSQYYILMKYLKHDQVNTFKTLLEEDKKIIGVWFEEEYVRTYPFEILASDIIGFTSADNTGYWGIEEYYNEELNGVNGREYGYYDSTLNIERIVKKPQNGYSIVSTIDANVQRIIQNHIKTFNEEFGSKSIGILAMNPNNGEIIAMASNDEYNLNNPRSLDGLYTAEEQAAMTQDQKMEVLNQLWKNDVISSSFEPGSTFKPITVATALEEALVSDNTTFVCDGGEHIGGFWIRCSSRIGHGIVTLGESLMKSCNDAMMQLAVMEGREMFYDYQTKFNIGRKTGVDLPGEEKGIIVPKDKLNSSELATSSFGQTFTVTMLQMASAYSSLVNGGNYYQPHIVKQIVNEKGATIKQFDKLLIRQAVSEETSELIQKYMYQTVELGTAKYAKVEGYAVGGKTGTAQKLPRDAKTYVVSFLGAVPAINPEIVIYIMIDEPQNVEKQADSSIATKLASRVLKEILPALGIFPEGEIDYLLEGETDEQGALNNNDGAVSNGDNGSTDNQEGTQTNNPEPNSENDGQNGDTGSNNQETTDTSDDTQGNTDTDSNPETQNTDHDTIEGNQEEPVNQDGEAILPGSLEEDEYVGDSIPPGMEEDILMNSDDESQENGPLNE